MEIKNEYQCMRLVGKHNTHILTTTIPCFMFSSLLGPSGTSTSNHLKYGDKIIIKTVPTRVWMPRGLSWHFINHHHQPIIRMHYPACCVYGKAFSVNVLPVLIASLTPRSESNWRLLRINVKSMATLPWTKEVSPYNGWLLLLYSFSSGAWDTEKRDQKEAWHNFSKP